MPSQPNPVTAIVPRSAPLSHRVGDRERSEACEELSAQFAAGRLTDEELEDRLAAAVEARTRYDLHRLLADLPSAGPSDRPAARAPDQVVRPVGPAPWNGFDVLAMLALIGCGGLAAIGVLIVLSMGDAALGAAATLSTVVAGVGGASAMHLLHRGWARHDARIRWEIESGRR